MSKRKRKTDPNIPAKKRLREIADRLWSCAVRNDWANRCAVCGLRRCEAHHLIPRHNQATRYELRNGIALCAKHHQFNKDVSPHQNAAGWMQWLRDHHPTIEQWYTATVESGDHCRFSGTTNEPYYISVIRELRQYVDIGDFERIAGLRFSRWLEDTDD